MTDPITPEQRARLLANGAEMERDEEFDPVPVLKLSILETGATWLLASLDPDCPSIGFALADLGFGFPEMGSVGLCRRLYAEREYARGEYFAFWLAYAETRTRECSTRARPRSRGTARDRIRPARRRRDEKSSDRSRGPGLRLQERGGTDLTHRAARASAEPPRQRSTGEDPWAKHAMASSGRTRP